MGQCGDTWGYPQNFYLQWAAVGIKLRAPHLKNIMGLVMGSCGLCLSEKKVVASCGNQVEGPSSGKCQGVDVGKFRATAEIVLKDIYL